MANYNKSFNFRNGDQVDDVPQIIDGKWTRVWTIRNATEEELNFYYVLNVACP